MTKSPRRFSLGMALIACMGLFAAGLRADETDDTNATASSQAIEESGSRELDWSSDYGAAVTKAQESERMLLVCFDSSNNSDVSSSIEKMVSEDGELAELIDQFELVRVTTESTFRTKGQERRLLEYSAFREMLNRPGLSIIDYQNTDTEHYGNVVTVYPLNGTRTLNRIALSTILSLPPGTLTQRTLVTAVSLHRERPQSVRAEWDSTLANAVERHSFHQARINLQGHHNWETRFHRLNALLGTGERTQEVCAESWPGQNLVEAAEECVHSWRQSSGHWSAVSANQRRFAYDMKRGSNGVWYATGIFAR